MDVFNLHVLLLWIQRGVSFCGVLVIFLGVLTALYRYLIYLFAKTDYITTMDLNQIRLRLGRVLTLGLEFIVAADLIGTTTTPDYYTVGIVAIIVLIRTLLSYTLNREINAITQQEGRVVS